MSSVYLKNVGPCPYLLGFACVYERSYAVDVSVEYVVLRVLMGAIDAFFCEQYSYVRSCNTGYI